MIKNILKKVQGFSPVELVLMVGFGALAAGALIYLGTTPHYMASNQPVNVNLKVDAPVATSGQSTVSALTSRQSSAKASQATGDYCNGGVDPGFGFELHGENIVCGNQTLCVTKSRNCPGGCPLPDIPPEYYSNSLLLYLWDNLPQYYKDMVTPQGLYFYYTHFGPATPASLTAMDRPSDFPTETEFSALNSKTHSFEFKVPLSYTLAPTVDMKMRGWYIDGSGVSGKDPVIIMTPGITNAIGDSLNANLRKEAAYFVSQGFDVVLFDKRNHGYSDGINPVIPNLGGAESWGEDIFRMLDQLESGVNAVGPSGTLEANKTGLLGSGYTAKTKPVVLWGLSQGASIMTRAMAMNYSSLPVDPRFDSSGNVDEVASAAVSAARSGYNFRGVVEMSGWSGSLKFLISPAFAWGSGGYLRSLSMLQLVPGSVRQSMENWPGYMHVKPTQDIGAIDGLVDAYNNKLKGFKKIVTVQGTHAAGLYNPTTLSYVMTETAKFAKQVTLNDATFDNLGTTTVQKEVCKAVALGNSGRLTANDLTVENQFKMLTGHYNN